MTPATVLSLSLGMTQTRGYHLDQYAAWMRSWNASPSTVAQRLVAARRTAQQWPDPGYVRQNDVAAWLSSEAFSPWTRVTYYGHLRSLFGWLTEAGHIPEDPTVRIRRPSAPRNRPRPLSPEEAAAALAGATGNLRSWLLIGLLAGLRAHETAKLHGSDVTEDAIYVRGKGGKDAFVPTHPDLWRLAQTYPRDGHWFPGLGGRPHICTDVVTRATTHHFRALGIAGSYHRCRHSYGTNLLRAGVNLRVVQDLMRHASLATTAAYLGVDEIERTEAIRRLAA